MICWTFAAATSAQSTIQLNDLSSFEAPGKTWQTASRVTADLNKTNALIVSAGSGILVNLPDKKDHGKDLFTKKEYGDIDLSLDYMMAKGSNSGIYLQGRYEIQLEDTWGSTTVTSAKNGGIYEQWDDARPEGEKGYGGFAPRQNASRAPGVWQHLKIAFQAPRFDAAGRKIAPAIMLRIELNGVLIHENVELPGPTRGGLTPEKATGPLRIQGDHGAVAFRNIQITPFDSGRPDAPKTSRRVYPITVLASTHPVFRSFMDLPGSHRVVHAISVGSEENVHYTYDTEKGMVIQVWRGDYLDATPMWYSRGDGSSRPLGTVQRFGDPVPALEKLASAQAAWKADTTGSNFKPLGYTLDVDSRPQFQYTAYGVRVNDAITVLPDGQGIRREISFQKPSPALYFRLAEGASIIDLGKGLYLVDDQSYYLRLEDTGNAKPIVRAASGRQELIVAVAADLKYSILF